MRVIENNVFGKLLSNIFCDGLFSADMDTKNADKKEHSFSRRKKRCTKMDKSGRKADAAL